MTIQIREFRCPTCGHTMGEEQYTHACHELNKVVTERVKERDTIKDEQHRKEIHELDEQHRKEIHELELYMESEIKNRLHQALSQERTTIEARYREALEEKDKQIETAKLEGIADMDEKIKQAVADSESRHSQKNSQFELQLTRIELRNKELMDQVEKLQKTLDNVPAEFKGTAFEKNILNELRNAFNRDSIQEKKFGKEMADIVQSIVTDSGEKIETPIVYDTKTGDEVSKADIEKAKRYKTIHNTDCCIIVTKKGIKPKDCQGEPSSLIGKREGIFLVHPSIVVGVARLIRNFIIENVKQARINNGTVSKYRKAYDYITSPERFRKIEDKIQWKLKLDELQRNEEDYHERKWKERKKAIQDWFEADMTDQKKIDHITQEDEVDKEDFNMVSNATT
jgi:hypothetical protein